jgi:hypothetical protein
MISSTFESPIPVGKGKTPVGDERIAEAAGKRRSLPTAAPACCER